MKISPTRMPEVMLVEPRVFRDERGFFTESWRRDTFAQHGLDLDFVQDNFSRSGRGVLRGLHYQLQRPQGKLIRVVRGAVFDVAVDIRMGSPTFGAWVGARLDDENQRQLYIPPGFAHGFCVLSESVDFAYKCTDYYAPADEYGIRWDDPGIGIDWPGGGFILSQKDLGLPRLDEVRHKLPVYKEGG